MSLFSLKWDTNNTYLIGLSKGSNNTVYLKREPHTSVCNDYNNDSDKEHALSCITSICNLQDAGEGWGRWGLLHRLDMTCVCRAHVSCCYGHPGIHIVLSYSAGVQRHLGIVYHVSGPVTVTLLRNWIPQSGNMWFVGKATSSEQGHFQAERARLCQLGYSPHKNLFVCVLFWMLTDIRPPWAVRGEYSPGKGRFRCIPLSGSLGC